MEMATEVGGEKVGVEIISKYLPEGWLIESTRFNRPNVMSCELVMGNLWIPFIVAYLLPSILNHLTDL